MFQIELFVLHIIIYELKDILKLYITFIIWIFKSIISSIFKSSFFRSYSHSCLRVVETYCLWFFIFKFKNYKGKMQPTSINNLCKNTSNFLCQVIYSIIFSQWLFIVFHFSDDWGRFLEFATNWPKNKEIF